MHNARLFFIAIVSAFLAVGICKAEVPLVAQAPPPVSFNPVKITGDTETSFSFESAWSTPYSENQNVPLHLFVPKSDRPIPVVIVLHYWGAVDLKAEADLAKRLNARGIGAVVMELPFHLSRAPRGTRSGELAIQPDPEKLKATMVQAVWDVRRTIDWIQTRPEFDGQKIGLSGTSLGAIVGSMVFAIEPRVGAYCSVLGGADLASTLWSSSRLVREREVLRRDGWTRDKLAEAIKDIEPAHFFKPDEARPAYLIAARYDTIVPVASYRALQSALPSIQTLWLETGHYGGFIVQNSVFGSVTHFFNDSFTGKSFTAPRRLYAPTFRIGAPANLESGLQVALGLDVWKSDEQGTAFGTIFITPKGPQGFIGAKVGSGLAFGVSILPKRTTLGVLWSFVL